MSTSATNATPTMLPYGLEFIGCGKDADKKALSLCQNEARADRDREHKGIKQRPLRRKNVLKVRVQINYKVRRGREVLRRAEGVQQQGSRRHVPESCRRSPLSRSFFFPPVSVMQGVRRSPRTSRRIGNEVRRRALRTRHLEKMASPCMPNREQKRIPQSLSTEGVSDINNVDRAPQGRIIVAPNRRTRAGPGRGLIYGVEILDAERIFGAGFGRARDAAHLRSQPTFDLRKSCTRGYPRQA